ncbi:hypothetical protein R3P38DRAFT_3229831 [Favolaschia claudopus]|uniref:Uncharacterized protein n=1 Tax=Favolaschia claudopus TaxID=2862362 RepID=A0AAV9ZPG1_9AGAR
MTEYIHSPSYKELAFYTPYTSIFSQYPSLKNMARSGLTKGQHDAIVGVTDIVSATKYPDRAKQRTFLDQQTVTLDSFSGLLGEIAKDKTLYDAFYSVKNSYHQTAVGSNGVIGGRYPLILELCAKIKAERELLRGSAVASQQAHRTELEEARAQAEDQESKNSRKPRAPRAKKDNKTKKSKATIEDGDESPFDDSELPGFVDDAMVVDDSNDASPSGHRATQSLDERNPATSQSGSTRPSSVRLSFLRIKGIDRNSASYIKAMAILARTDPSSASAIVVEDFPVPPPRKRARPSQPLAHEDSVEQYDATDLSVNNPTVRQTVAEARDAVKSSAADSMGSLRLQEAELRSRVGFENAQLRYHLDHREYLLTDLRRVLDAQHKREQVLPTGNA